MPPVQLANVLAAAAALSGSTERDPVYYETLFWSDAEAHRRVLARDLYSCALVARAILWHAGADLPADYAGPYIGRQDAVSGLIRAARLAGAVVPPTIDTLTRPGVFWVQGRNGIPSYSRRGAPQCEHVGLTYARNPQPDDGPSWQRIWSVEGGSRNPAGIDGVRGGARDVWCDDASVAWIGGPGDRSRSAGPPMRRVWLALDATLFPARQ